ncbi:hypothetical protein BDZ91DRAFT_452889 [Kalaharituber pfeilii]|nr:hypothetical protein BDZ91DRAFT_452889 [Kalaharituber pfeilii]
MPTNFITEIARNNNSPTSSHPHLQSHRICQHQHSHRHLESEKSQHPVVESGVAGRSQFQKRNEKLKNKKSQKDYCLAVDAFVVRFFEPKGRRLPTVQ